MTKWTNTQRARAALRTERAYMSLRQPAGPRNNSAKLQVPLTDLVFNSTTWALLILVPFSFPFAALGIHLTGLWVAMVVVVLVVLFTVLSWVCGILSSLCTSQIRGETKSRAFPEAGCFYSGYFCLGRGD